MTEHMYARPHPALSIPADLKPRRRKPMYAYRIFIIHTKAFLTTLNRKSINPWYNFIRVGIPEFLDIVKKARWSQVTFGLML